MRAASSPDDRVAPLENAAESRGRTAVGPRRCRHRRGRRGNREGIQVGGGAAQTGRVWSADEVQLGIGFETARRITSNQPASAPPRRRRSCRRARRRWPRSRHSGRATCRTAVRERPEFVPGAAPPSTPAAAGSRPRNRCRRQRSLTAEPSGTPARPAAIRLRPQAVARGFGSGIRTSRVRIYCRGKPLLHSSNRVDAGADLCKGNTQPSVAFGLLKARLRTRSEGKQLPDYGTIGPIWLKGALRAALMRSSSACRPGDAGHRYRAAADPGRRHDQRHRARAGGHLGRSPTERWRSSTSRPASGRRVATNGDRRVHVQGQTRAATGRVDAARRRGAVKQPSVINVNASDVDAHADFVLGVARVARPRTQTLRAARTASAPQAPEPQFPCKVNAPQPLSAPVSALEFSAQWRACTSGSSCARSWSSRLCGPSAARSPRHARASTGWSSPPTSSGSSGTASGERTTTGRARRLFPREPQPAVVGRRPVGDGDAAERDHAGRRDRTGLRRRHAVRAVLFRAADRDDHPVA